MPADPEAFHYHEKPLGVRKGSPGVGIEIGSRQPNEGGGWELHRGQASAGTGPARTFRRGFIADAMRLGRAGCRLNPSQSSPGLTDPSILNSASCVTVGQPGGHLDLAKADSVNLAQHPSLP